VSSEPTDRRARARIGRYAVLGRIGKGGMGMVYRCLDEALEREVAVKTLTGEGNLDEESRKRFEVEAKAAARLQHPNIVTVFERGEDRGVPFIAMEMLPGMDLEALLRSGETLPLAEKLDIALQIARGLDFAHENRIVHRDIKPSNIRLLDDGTAKIMDFGIAKQEGTQLTKTGMMLGTVHYMSPEQVRGQKLDGRSDVFSLGVILYEMLAGRRPFKGEGPTDVLYKIVHEEAPPLDLGSLGPDVSPRLQAIVARALAKNLPERYESAAQLVDDLAEALAAQRRAEGGGAMAAAVQEAVTAARRIVKEGRTDEGVRRLRELQEAHPNSLETRRALRSALREKSRKVTPPEPEATAFPELEATFQAPPTSREPETLLQPTAILPDAPGVEKRRPSRTPLLVRGPLALVGVVALGSVLLRKTEPPAAAEVRIPVRSQPMGATVLLDGRDTGVVTNGEVVIQAPAPPQVVLTFHKDGQRDEKRIVKLPLADGEAVSVALLAAATTLPLKTDPPGAAVALDGEKLAASTPLELSFDPATEHRLSVSLEGHVTQELRLLPGKTPAALSLKLEPAGPQGALAIASAYPVDVVWKGRVLAKDQLSPRVSLPGGRQTVTLVSPTVFLKTDLSVSVTGGEEAALQAPGLGKLNVRALPDNCQVAIDGTFVDYPPILNKAVAAGTHVVSFTWPDGKKAQEPVEVTAGGAAFVTGRKD
jgi:Protein kinase domain/PEGA domain